MIARACRALAAWLRACGRYERIPRGWLNASDYLDRYFISHSTRFRPGCYLHHFLAPDDDGEVHDHPWAFAVAIVLSGGYREERLCGRVLVVRRLRPGSINVIFGSTFHRIARVGPECWTLFFSFFRRKRWGFLNLATGEFVDWEVHRDRKRQGKPGFPPKEEP